MLVQTNGLQKWMQDFDRSFDFYRPSPLFKTDILNDGDNYVLSAELPGFNKEEIKLSIDGDILSISAESVKETNEENYIRRERTVTSCRRSFDISDVNADEIMAEYENGILKLTLPKRQKGNGKREIAIM